MKQFLIIILVILVLVGGYFLTSKNDGQVVVPPTPEYIGEPTFSWEYEAFMDGEFPKTRITLHAKYENEMIKSKVIDAVDGSCNDYAEHFDVDKDVYPRSTMIICYGAGLGHYFKVVQNGTAYEVMRKIFEEGSPDFVPPEQPFVKVAEF